MKTIINLAEQKWTLTGYNPNFHLLKKSWEIRDPVIAFTEPVPATVPGSVQQNLKKAGIVPDWKIGRNSVNSEWVENRDWSFATTIAPDGLAGKKVVLNCEGLDYKGLVKLNGEIIGSFADANIPHKFELSSHLSAAGENRLEIVFQAQDLPRWLGQVFYTSKVREQKPRFYYTWDWIPRIVQIGIWDAIYLEVSSKPTVQKFNFYSKFDYVNGMGWLMFKVETDSAPGCQLKLSLWDENNVLNTELIPLGEWNQTVWRATKSCSVSAWWPNLCGSQKIYEVKLELLDERGGPLDRIVRKTGFRSIRWNTCEGANPAADPWLCEINGKNIFLWGVNWVPTLPNFADESPARIGLMLKRYQEMGCNTIRVNGCAILGKETLYEQCDALGIMVWQDFTLSSSGLDNHPSDDLTLIEIYARQARSIIGRRQNHPSLLLWCGGNELYETGTDANGLLKGYPLPKSHPMLKRFEEIVLAEDPTRRFISSSASGPLSTATSEEMGQGRAWDVHGPWNIVEDEKTTEEYWAKDDALFRSEVGFPGAMSADLIRKYAGDLATWPVQRKTELYKVCGWWLNSDIFEKDHGRSPENLEEYCEWSQKKQAKWLLHALKAVRSRFPRAGGMLLWMGHDCFPCPINTSVIDFEGNPKLSALELGRWIKSISPHQKTLASFEKQNGNDQSTVEVPVESIMTENV